MPVYLLSPIDPKHPDWETSTHKDFCRIHAPNEDAARDYAVREFAIAVPKRLGMEISNPPWKDPERVRCAEMWAEASDHSGNYHEGRIEVPGGDQSSSRVDEFADIRVPFRTANPGRDPADQEPTIEEQGGVIPPDAASRVIQNKTTIQAQTHVLLASLDEVLNPDPQRNEPPPMFWLTGEEGDGSDEELKDLLRQVRDQLRTFNTLLSEGRLDEASTGPVAERLQESAWNYIVRVNGATGATVATTGSGGLFVVGLAQLLDQSGLLPWDRTIELLRVLLHGA